MKYVTYVIMAVVASCFQFRTHVIYRIHKEQMEKWQEEIKELRLLDASNEEASGILHNARCLIQNPNIDS